MENKNNKRQYRELDDDTKAKISAGLRNRMKSATHRNNIAQSMVNYWKTVPHREVEDSKNKKSNPQPDGIM